MSTADPCTVVGAEGYIGRHLVRHLRHRGVNVHPVGRRGQMPNEPGTVVFAAGVTSDFRTRPLDAMEAHVGALLDVVRAGKLTRLVYLSSTRVYAGSSSTTEDQPLVTNPNVGDDLYNISKLAGESCALACGVPAVVARISNVFGGDADSSNFLTDVIRAAVRDGRVAVHSAPASSKDYVHVGDVVDALHALAMGGHTGMFNVASGNNTSNASVLDAVSKATGCTVTWEPAPVPVIFPHIDVTRLRSMAAWTPRHVLDHMDALVKDARNAQGEGP